MSNSPAVDRALYPLALIADSERDARDLYGAALGLIVGEFAFAEDGRDALVKALAAPPSVVIADARLPFIDGYALCSLLRRDSATSTIPFVLISCNDGPADTQRAARAGADALIQKPCLPEVLCAELQRLAKKSDELRDRSRATRERVGEHVANADAPHTRTRNGRPVLSQAHRRYDHVTPGIAPALACPSCYRPLCYVRSEIGGVDARNPERWDYYECVAGCGTFQHRARTRRLRRV